MNAYLTGREISTPLNSHELHTVNEFLCSRGKPNLTTNNVVSYSKAIINHKVILSHTRSRAARSNRYTVVFMDKGGVSYGLVEKLISTHGYQIKQLMVIDNPLLVHCKDNSVSSKLLEDFVFVKELDKCIAVVVENIAMKCFNTSTGTRSTQVTRIVNNVELVL